MQANSAAAPPARRHKVQSAEIALDLLKILAEAGGRASLSALAEAAGMPASKAHRYLKSLAAAGFAEQEASSGRYVLGPEALQVGLAALGRIDVVASGADLLSDLNTGVGHTCFLAVWGNHGPTVVAVREAAGLVTTVTRVGSVLPLLTSATGLAFSAYLPLRELERIDGPAPPAAQTRLDEVRTLGLAIVRSLYHPGIDAIAAPVFGPFGAVAAVITLLGPTTSLDLDPEGPAARAVRDAAAALGRRIGAAHAEAAPSARAPA